MILMKLIALLLVLCAMPVHCSSATLPPQFEKVRTVISDAIEDNAFPSAVVAVMQHNRVIFHEAFGQLTYDPSSPKTDTTTIYDLASVTKVLATTLSLMRLYDEGKINPDDPVIKFIPEFGVNGKERLTLRNLFLHNGGLVEFRKYIGTCKTPEAVMQAIYSDTLVYPTGTRTVYSDLDFILLGEVIYRMTGKRLDRYFDEMFAKPLGLTSTFFCPPDAQLSRIAPTEADTNWHLPQKRPLVHDPNAALLQGVAGHAGLFSTSGDILKVMKMVMAGGCANGKRFLKKETIRIFTTRDPVLGQRALGWDIKSGGEKASAGKYFSLKSYGHLGFT
ncbi:MAG: serine hydrolase, partial [Chlorobiales bacterium]|nr:serine hydrolase [Chlorobiales bacterium]